MKRIAVYGSLRSGMFNHESWMRGAQYVGSQTISGFDMYSLGAYPCIAYGSGNVLFEVYDVPEYTADNIRSMELDAGYAAAELTTLWGKAEIFVFPQELIKRFNIHVPVPDGDWNKYQLNMDHKLAEAQR